MHILRFGWPSFYVLNVCWKREEILKKLTLFGRNNSLPHLPKILWMNNFKIVQMFC